MSDLADYWKLCQSHRETYGTIPVKWIQYPKRYTRGLEFLEKNHWKVKTVLEIGCFSGYGINILSKAGYDVLGIEISRQAIEKRLSKEIITASVEHLPFSDGAFDLVFSVAVFEHLCESGIDLVLKEVMRVGKYNYHSPAFDCGYEEGWHSTVRPLEWWLERLKKLGADLQYWHLEDIVWAD